MKSTDAIENKTDSQEEMKNVYDELSTPEQKYRKKILFLDYRIATQQEQIVTSIDGKIETKNTATPGSYILTGSKGENYVLPPEKFNLRYEIDSTTKKAKTKPVETLAKIFVGPTISFIAPWNEKMIIESGDALINNNGEFYRIEKSAFANTYEKI